MNIRFYNANILTLEKGFEITQGELWVKGNRIIHVGEVHREKRSYDEAAIVWDREINVEGNLIMPGFKNAHTHSGMTFLRSYTDDLPLHEWLNNSIFPLEAKLTPEDIYYTSKLAILEYLSSGITANFDMYLTPDTIAEASIDCGFRTVQTGAIHDHSQSLEQLECWFRKYNNYHELHSFILGFHAEYTCSKELLMGISELAHTYKSPVFSHNSETLSEVKECINRNYATPTQYFEDLGLFDYGGGGYHCTFVTEDDLHIFKRKGLSFVTCPASNAKLASGIAPVQKAVDMGINVAIGTDGPASNNSLDMFREMYLASVLAKLREKEPTVGKAENILYMATVGSARAMGLNECDTIAEGKLADLIIIDLNDPNMQPLNNIVNNLVYAGNKQNVKLTMVNGRILYENGEYYIGSDVHEIYEKVNQIIRRISA